MNDETATPPSPTAAAPLTVGPSVWSMIVGGAALGLGFYAARGPDAIRRARDRRWHDNLRAAEDFQLRMGYTRAADKQRFMRQHFHFPTAARGGRL